MPTIFARTIPTRRCRTNIVGVQFALSNQYDGARPLFREGAFEIDILDVAAYWLSGF